jgi:type II secretory pathway predicted ATPase ExeA
VSQQFSKVPFDGGRILRHLATDPQSAPPPATPFSPSLTYELYYGLKEKPFSLSADPRFLLRTPTHGPAFDDMLNGIRRREGLIVLSGDSGYGKTTLVRSVLQNLDRRTFSAFVPDPFVSREDLLKMLLVDFGVVSIADLKRGSLNGASRPDLSYPLYEFLDSLVPLQAFAVVVVDEAQNIPLPLLEEIRILSDLEGREKLLQVVLVGQPELRANLKLPQMRQVDQRVSVRCELSPLGLEDVAGYVRHRLNIAGDGDSRAEFTDDAIAIVHRGSRGTPRLINKICDRALTRGYALRVNRIDADIATAAVRDAALDREEPPSRAALTASREETIGLSQFTSDQSEWTSDFGSMLPPAIVPPIQPESVEAEPYVMSEFAAEHEPSRAVRIDPPPPPSWRPRTVAVIAVAVALSAMVVFLYVQSRAGDIPMVTLPPAPTRPPVLTHTSPAVPAGWMIPARSIARNGAAVPSALDTFAIQVASFNTQAGAQAFIKELADAGDKGRAVTVDYGPPRGQLVRVVVGDYRSAGEALADLVRLRDRFADARVERVAAR